jgi:hypothetical protein
MIARTKYRIGGKIRNRQEQGLRDEEASGRNSRARNNKMASQKFWDLQREIKLINFYMIHMCII